MDSGRAKRIRTVSSTALVYCEGVHDLTFLRHLIKLYTRERTVTTKFRTKQGKGGSPDTLVIEALNTPGDFDRRLVKADRDRDPAEIERAESLAAEHSAVVVWSIPCLEALLLSVIDGGDYSGRQSKDCKDMFESTHIKAEKRTDGQAYTRIYTLEVLEAARQRLPELDQLVGFITS